MPMTVIRRGLLISIMSFFLVPYFDNCAGPAARRSARALLVGEALAGAGHLVVAGNAGVEPLARDMEPVAGAVDRELVAREIVVQPPPLVDLMVREAVLDAVDSDVVDDLPAVALDIDPGGRRGRVHAGAVEVVALDNAAGCPLLDVDVLGGAIRDEVSPAGVGVALVYLAFAVPPPLAW